MGEKPRSSWFEGGQFESKPEKETPDTELQHSNLCDTCILTGKQCALETWERYKDEPGMPTFDQLRRVLDERSCPNQPKEE